MQAFSAIPASERAGHRVTDPARALAGLLREYHHEADAWVLLSHSGFEEDLKLAATCQFLDVIFAGHCHSRRDAPELSGKTLVVKGAELSAGYAHAEPVSAGWTAGICRFPPAGGLPDELEHVGQEIALIGQRLAAPLGLVAGRWRHSMPDRREVLAETARRLRSGPRAPAVILNETALRPAALGEVLRLADLMTIEPFGNRLVRAPVPDAADLLGLLTCLADRAGPLVVAPGPLPAGIRSVLTTDYLAETFMEGSAHATGLRLGDAVRHVLADPLPAAEEGAPA